LFDKLRRVSGTAPLQGNLFATGPVTFGGPTDFERIDLGGGAWIDVCRSWLGGADEVAQRIVAATEWRCHRRKMYDRIVDEPRLSRWFRADEPLPDETLGRFRAAVASHYGVGFGALGLNYYRNGDDSVAFHADRELKDLDDTLVAILTLGSTRPFLLRPLGGGRSVELRPASGDLVVMGGACQKSWEHAVPKVSRGAGPRVSASIRWARRGGAEFEWTPSDRRVGDL
jgi:alkylated DNA repair dioxygenase AlkB